MLRYWSAREGLTSHGTKPLVSDNEDADAAAEAMHRDGCGQRGSCGERNDSALAISLLHTPHGGYFRPDILISC